MPARTFPNLGLKGGYEDHEGGWADDMNVNLLKLSALAQGAVKAKVNTTPGSPVNGDVYLFDETHPTHANAVAIYEGAALDEAWTYVTPKEGWLVYNQNENYFEKFSGSVWAEFSAGGGGSGVPNGGSTGQVLTKLSDDNGDADWEDPSVSSGTLAGLPWGFMPPAASNFTLASGDATNLTLTGDKDAGLLFDSGTPAAGNITRWAYMELDDPTADWEMTCRIPVVIENVNYMAAGLFIQDSVSQRIVRAGLTQKTTISYAIETYADLATYNSAFTDRTVTSALNWLRIARVGANYIFSVSADGKSWVEMYSSAVSAYLTNPADRVGFGLSISKAGGSHVAGSIPYFALTGDGAPPEVVLGPARTLTVAAQPANWVTAASWYWDGTDVQIISSTNVAGITRNFSGSYTIEFVEAAPNDQYEVFGAGVLPAAANSDIVRGGEFAQGGGNTTTTCTVIMDVASAGAGGGYDAPRMSVMMFGMGALPFAGGGGGGGGVTIDVPPVSAFTLGHSNNETGNFTLEYDDDLGLTVHHLTNYSGTGDRHRFATFPIPVPANDWVLIAEAQNVHMNRAKDYACVGLILRNSAANKLAIFHFYKKDSGGSYTTVDYWNNDGNGYGGATSGKYYAPDAIKHLRVRKEGENLYFDISPNGRYWDLMATTLANEFIGAAPDQIGLITGGNQIGGTAMLGGGEHMTVEKFIFTQA